MIRTYDAMKFRSNRAVSFMNVPLTNPGLLARSSLSQRRYLPVCHAERIVPPAIVKTKEYLEVHQYAK